MLSAREARLTGVRREGKVPGVTSSLAQSEELFRFDPSTESSLSSSPLLRDPYEDQVLTVRQSSVPGAGRGVFTRRHVRWVSGARSNVTMNLSSNNTVMGYFNGVHRPKSDVFQSFSKSVYLVQGPDPREFLDIPPEYQSRGAYQASTGHLINHNTAGNVIYMECHHPRFGHILCIVSTRDIHRDEELFVTYDLAVDGAGLKAAMKTALKVGHLLSGKSREEFSRDIRPYVKMASQLADSLKLSSFIKF